MEKLVLRIRKDIKNKKKVSTEISTEKEEIENSTGNYPENDFGFLIKKLQKYNKNMHKIRDIKLLNKQNGYSLIVVVKKKIICGIVYQIKMIDETGEIDGVTSEIDIEPGDIVLLKDCSMWRNCLLNITNENVIKIIK